MENTIIKSINLFSHIKNDDVFKIFDLAEKNKFNIWIVGGAIRDFFLKNPRMRMLISSFDKMDESKRNIHLENAESFLKKLDK